MPGLPPLLASLASLAVPTFDSHYSLRTERERHLGQVSDQSAGGRGERRVGTWCSVARECNHYEIRIVVGVMVRA